MFKYGFELADHCQKNDLRICDVAVSHEMQVGECSREEVFKRLKKRRNVMYSACHSTLHNPVPSVSGLTGGDASRLYRYSGEGSPLSGDTVARAMSYALSCFEVNTSMGPIVACPTAGSCGIVPGALFAAAETLDASEEALLESFATAAYIGMIISKNATVSGAEGGCQAECGSASAMAAAALAEMQGGSPQQCLDAAAIALKNVMGLVCDPVAGLVEIPCATRNASGVANALLSADLVMAGIRSMIPFDEVVSAMYKVGRMLPEALRETAKGGVATTPTGLRYKKQVFGE